MDLRARTSLADPATRIKRTPRRIFAFEGILPFTRWRNPYVDFDGDKAVARIGNGSGGSFDSRLELLSALSLLFARR